MHHFFMRVNYCINAIKNSYKCEFELALLSLGELILAQRIGSAA